MCTVRATSSHITAAFTAAFADAPMTVGTGMITEFDADEEGSESETPEEPAAV